jgi:hypothetical protein
MNFEFGLKIYEAGITGGGIALVLHNEIPPRV